ncbi:MAG: DUF4261 domain-containing protein [Myxococcota bacterium]
MTSEEPSQRTATLFAPGPWSGEAEAKKALKAKGVELEWVENDGGFADAFSFGRFPKDSLPVLDRCRGAVVLTVPLELGAEGRALLEVGRALERAGAHGVRVEDSKAAWELGPWIALLEAGDVFSLYQAVVVGMTGGADEPTSVIGMHVFGRPDAQIAGVKPNVANRYLTSLCLYQLDEDPELASGHTFSPDAESPRMTLERWPDDRYPLGHVCHNPFGVWRLSAEGRPRQIAELALTPIPTLIALLGAAEEKAGRALSRKEVEALVEAAVCMAMPRKQARLLELSRGYADLDPELAFDQWQIVREGLS